jgi:hypothetical protein
MLQGKPRDVRKERRWRQAIREWQASGLTVRAYCQCHHLSVPSFYAWRRELQRRAAGTPAFVPIRVLASPATPVPAPTPLEVVLPSGRSVRVGPGFDAATLRQILAVLEEPRSC